MQIQTKELLKNTSNYLRDQPSIDCAVNIDTFLSLDKKNSKGLDTSVNESPLIARSSINKRIVK